MFTKLKRHWEAKSSRSIISLFDDPNRALEFSIDLGDLFLITRRPKLIRNVVLNF